MTLRHHRLAGPALLASAVVVVFTAGFVTRTAFTPEPAPAVAVSDPCAVPAGLRLETLAAQDRALVALRHIACRDRATGRTTEAEYRETVRAIDRAWLVPAAPPEPIWASKVLGFSSQYTADSWSAAQILGAPNVFPALGDHSEAWAPLTADDRDEWIEVGFEQPRPISAVQVFETFNPGAITKLELITVTGRRIHAFTGTPGARGTGKRAFEVQCTSEPIAAVRVELGSRAVAGWNELDAIGVVPCR